ncbi:hypothetical protein ACFSL4_34765 [Streptomyces caeni]|uniref:Transposase n=1 Tax=Streptomyces caeni TaxID=2307231 RepID=A0ABW4J312_9ACTN
MLPESAMPVMVLGAVLQDGTLVAQQKVADKGSENTGFAALLAALELEDGVVVADALHTLAARAGRLPLHGTRSRPH